VLGIELKVIDVFEPVPVAVAIDSNEGGTYGELPTNIDLLITLFFILKTAIKHLLVG
jgi:hypothetical protein